MRIPDENRDVKKPSYSNIRKGEVNPDADPADGQILGTFIQMRRIKKAN
jgi:hypothetical protein